MTLKTKARLRIWDNAFLNGHPGNIRLSTKLYIMRAYRYGLVCTSTTDGHHAPNSWHYSGKAADVAGSYDNMVRFQRYEHRIWGRRHIELFGPNNAANRKNGRPLRLVEGSGLENQHDNHVHGACYF